LIIKYWSYRFSKLAMGY